jgi:hypothetical protein
MSTIALPALLPAEIVPGPAAQMRIPERSCMWRGWVDTNIIFRTREPVLPAIETRVRFFAVFKESDVANSWQPFEMHTVKSMRASEVAKLLGHCFKSRKADLQLKPFLRHEKFSDAEHAKFVVGVHPDFDTRTFLSDRGLRSGEGIEEEDPDAFLINSHEEGNTGDENEEEDPGDERADSEASRLSTEREEIGNQSPGPEATNTHVYNACNFLCFWTKTKPNARYA